VVTLCKFFCWEEHMLQVVHTFLSSRLSLVRICFKFHNREKKAPQLAGRHMDLWLDCN
jgi:hypothetical protein